MAVQDLLNLLRLVSVNNNRVQRRTKIFPSIGFLSILVNLIT